MSSITERVAAASERHRAQERLEQALLDLERVAAELARHRVTGLDENYSTCTCGWTSDALRGSPALQVALHQHRAVTSALNSLRLS